MYVFKTLMQWPHATLHNQGSNSVYQTQLFPTLPCMAILDSTQILITALQNSTQPYLNLPHLLYHHSTML